MIAVYYMLKDVTLVYFLHKNRNQMMIADCVRNIEVEWSKNNLKLYEYLKKSLYMRS